MGSSVFKSYLFVIENNALKKKYIETGIETDFDVEVLSGLEEGDHYVKNPSETLKEGTIVTVSSPKEVKNEK